jgi:four helix bundle protein
MESGFWDLKVVQRSFELALQVYDLTEAFPDKERYRLVDQLCRAVVSVPANIAEADGRYTRPDQLRFLYIARGSLNETQVLLRIAKLKGYAPADRFPALEEIAAYTGRLLNGLIRSKRQDV